MRKPSWCEPGRVFLLLWHYSTVMVSESSFSFTAFSTIAAMLSGSAPWFVARAFMASVSAVICVSMMCVCASMYPSLSPSFAVVPLYFTGCSVISWPMFDAWVLSSHLLRR